MLYVKVDKDGNVVEFPYQLILRRPNDLPEDARPVDLQSQKIATKWYEGLWYDRVERQGDTYVVYYTKGLKKYDSDEQKKSTLTILLKDAYEKNQLALNSGNIDETTFNSNKQILNSVNVEDENTYDLFDTVRL